MGHVLPSGTYAGVKDPLWIPSSGNPVFETVTAQVLKSTSVSTNTVFLQNNALTATTNVLALNGLPLATTENLSTIMDWSLYPAFSTINANNNIISNVSTLTAENIKVTTLGPRVPGDPPGEILVGSDLFFVETSIVNATSVDSLSLNVGTIQAQNGDPDVLFNANLVAGNIRAPVNTQLSLTGTGVSLTGNTTINGTLTTTGNTTTNGNITANLVTGNRVSANFLGSRTLGEPVTVSDDLDIGGQAINNIGSLGAEVGLPLLLNSAIQMNNRNILGVNALDAATVVSPSVLALALGSGVVGTPVSVTSPLQINNNNILGVNLTNTQVATIRGSIIINPTPGPGANAVVTANNRGELLVNGRLPVIGASLAVPAGTLNQVIAIPGMTAFGLVQLTYFALNGNGPNGPQTFQSVDYNANSVTVNLNRAAIAGDRINWSVINY